MQKLLLESVVEVLLLLVFNGPGYFLYDSHLMEAFDGAEHFVDLVFSVFVVGCPIDFEPFEFSPHSTVSMCSKN
jgi:hypothetical protein